MGTAIDAALISAAQGGDGQAMAALVAEAMPLVYKIVGKALGGSPDVDDVVQETMLRVVRGIAGLRDPDSFRSWVISIAYRQVQERGRSIRAATVRGPLVEDVSGWPDPAGDFVDSAMFRLHLAGERRETGEASRWLSAEDQRVLELWWRESAGLMTRAELAGALGLTVAHAAVRVQRAKAQLALARTVLRAWQAHPRCEQLAVAAERAGGPADPRWFSRLGRHVRRCGACAAHERELIPAEHLLAGASVAPALAVLAGLAGSAGAAGGGAAGVVGAGTAGAAGAGAAGAAGAGAAGAAGAAGGGAASGAAVPIWWLWDLLQRAGRYALAKSLPIAGIAAAGAATAIVYAVHYQPFQDRGPDLAVPPATVTSQPTRPAATAGGTATPADPRPAGAFSGVATASYYIAPGGSDTNPGSIDRPLATLGKAVSMVRPGQTIALRGGVYQPTRPVEITANGTADRRIVLSNYRDERPIIDAGGLPAGAPFVTQRASYWTVQGLEIRNAPGHGYLCRSCRYDVFRALSIHDNGQTGLQLRDSNTTGNLILDSDFFRNHDDASKGEFADGVGIEYGSGAGNTVRGCRVYENSDDGLGLHEFTSPVTIQDSWSFGNGVNRWNIAGFAGDGYGFKLGGGEPPPPANHTITGSAAWDNAGYGFTESGNAGALTVRNNTAFRNGKTGFAFEQSAAVLRDNIASGNARDVNLGRRVDAAGNSWDRPGWSAGVLRTGDRESALAPRSADGALPPTTFLTKTNDEQIGAPMTPGGG